MGISFPRLFVAFCLAGLALGTGIDIDLSHDRRCPPFPKGPFDIHRFQLHPDTAIFDPRECVMWVRCAIYPSYPLYTF